MTAAARDGIQRGQHVSRTLRPVVRILLEALHHHRRELRRHVRATLEHVFRLLREVRDEELRRRTVAERRASRQQLVRHASERVEVRAVIGIRIARRLLGRDVRGRSDARPRRGQRAARHRGPRRRDGLRDSEVGDRCRTAGHQHVVRLDVAVNHSLPVRVLERPRHVVKDGVHVAQRQGAVLREPRSQRLTLDEWHRIVRQPVHRAGRMHRHHVRMLEARRHLDLSMEPLDADSRRELRREDLQRDGAAEGDLVGNEDARHAAPAELAVQTVGITESGLDSVAESSVHRVCLCTASGSIGRDDGGNLRVKRAGGERA